MGLRLQMKFKDKGSLTTGLDERVTAFELLASQARKQAADAATRASRAKVKRVRPPAPPRPGRSFAPIENTLEWKSGKTKTSDLIQLNESELSTRAGHWLVQNVGTGRSAVVHKAGKPNPTGRPAKGATYVRAIKSQKGRRIRAGLVFATGPGGTFVPPSIGQRGNHQLQLRSKVKGGPWTTHRSQAGIIIDKEIEPQRFVQAGAKEGFRLYRRSVLAAARSEFNKPKG